MCEGAPTLACEPPSCFTNILLQLRTPFNILHHIRGLIKHTSISWPRENIIQLLTLESLSDGKGVDPGQELPIDQHQDSEEESAARLAERVNKYLVKIL